MSKLNEEKIGQLIKQKLPAQRVFVEDFSDGCGTKFNIVVVAQIFEGKSLLDRQRAVNETLKEVMPQIHAITMKTWTEEQYQARKDTLTGTKWHVFE